MDDLEWASFIETKFVEHKSANAQPEAPLASLTTQSDTRLSRTIDHTLLKPDATLAQIDTLCDEALRYNFKSCCVNEIHVPRVVERLRGSETLVCCVINFPLGACAAESTALAARTAVTAGAQEIDTVLPLPYILSTPPKYAALYDHLYRTIQAVSPTPVKVILETALIPNSQLKFAACIIAAEAGAAFVKTCTGFAGGHGATTGDVRLMFEAVKGYGKVKVKASGGVRTFLGCKEMFGSGAERIGTSSGVSIIQDKTVQQGGGGY